MNLGGGGWGGGRGCNTPKKSKKGGPTCAEGGPGMLELKDLFAKLWKFQGNVVLRNILETFVFENITSPPSPTFPGKIFAFRKKFLGALEWKAQILESPPTRNRLARPWSGAKTIPHAVS